MQPLGPGTPLFDAAVRAAAAGLNAATPEAGALPADLSSDSIAALLDRLAAPGVADLILSLEDRRAALDPGALDALVRVMGDPETLARAIEHVVKEHPEWPAKLRAESKLAAVHPQLTSVLDRLKGEARLRAATSIALAEEGISFASANRPAQEIADARTLLDVANRLVATEEHAHYVRAAELADVMLLQFPVTPPPPPPLPRQAGVAIGRERARWREALHEWWKRAPVLVMIGAWFAAGALMAAFSLVLAWNPRTAALVWAIGCLLFGVWIRIRSLRV